MVFDGSGKFQPGIEEAYDSGVVLYEYLDDCWKTEDSWGVLTAESFNGGGTGITRDVKSFLIELM